MPLPTVRVQIAVNTYSGEYGVLRVGQQIDVQPLDGAIWIENGIAVAIPGVTPSAAAPSITAGSVALSAPGPLAAGQLVEFVQADDFIQGLGVLFQNGRLFIRNKGFYTITLYLLCDRRVNGLASIRGGGQDYRSMPLVDTAGSKGHGTAASVTCLAVGNVPESTEISVVFDNTDTVSTNLIEGDLAVMGG